MRKRLQESGVAMSRDEAIALLISDTVDRLLNSRQVFWLQKILENGFPGYAKWSDDELQREIMERGLDGEGAESPVDVDSGTCDDWLVGDDIYARMVDCAGFSR